MSSALLPPLQLECSPLRPIQGCEKKGDPVVFGRDRKAAKEINRLARIYKLSKALPAHPDDAAYVLELLSKVWANALENLKTSSDAARASIAKGLPKVGAKFNSIYRDEFPLGADLMKKITSFAKDPKRVTIPPLFKSLRATQGPTFLVTYPTSKPGRQATRELVLKNSDIQERVLSRFYHGVSTGFTSEGTRYGFAVPFSSWVDLEKSTHENYKGEITHTEFARAIKEDFTQLAKTDDRDFIREVHHIKLEEMVPGQNLLDFAVYDYKKLTEDQRIKLFERLGRLAMIDLLAGNKDRLIMVHQDDESSPYDLKALLGCNLGNVMVTHSPDDKVPFYFHAIDSGEQVQDDIKYMKFLHSLFSEDKPYDLLARNIADCFQNALSDQADDIDVDGKSEKDEDPAVKRAALAKEIRADLKNDKIAFDALKLGLSSMAIRLQKEVIPNWGKTEEAAQLKTYIQRVYPEFLKTIESRFKWFQTLRLS